jgi:hypothetical protein
MIIQTVQTPKNTSLTIRITEENMGDLDRAITAGLNDGAVAAYVLCQECYRGLHLNSPEEFVNIALVLTQHVQKEKSSDTPAAG